MQLQIANRQYQISGNPLGTGGEGEIYALDQAKVVKIYHEGLLDTQRRQKVLALCDSYKNFLSRHGGYSIAFPEYPAHKDHVAFDGIVGFSMARYEFPKLSELGYNLAESGFEEAKGVKFSDGSAIDCVYRLFDILDKLHRNRIILGDINPDNIEFDLQGVSPVIIDVDAAQLGGFPCLATHPDYNDPRVVPLGMKSSSFTYDAGSDIFALAIVAFEFLVGARPHMLHSSPPTKDKNNKAAGISSIKCWADGRDYLRDHGLSYFECLENEVVEARLSSLQKQDRRLIAFFYQLFVENSRDGLVQSLPLTDPRHPAHHFLVESGFKAVVDDEARSRARARTLARQGAHRAHAPVPDSGFKALIGSVLGKPSGPPARPLPILDRSDPAPFSQFLDRFGLHPIS